MRPKEAVATGGTTVTYARTWLRGGAWDREVAVVELARLRVKAEADTEGKALPGTGVEAETQPPIMELETTVREEEGGGAGTPGLKPNASVWSAGPSPWDPRSETEGLAAAVDSP